MPKVVDTGERRQRIFEAVFDVVVEAGIGQVTLRAVADAAGLAIGSVRHYFSSRDELIGAASEEVIERITARIAEHRDRLDGSKDRLAIAEDMLCELLPLTELTSREVLVWLEIVTSGRTDPVLSASADRLFTGSRTLAGLIVMHAELVPKSESVLETERLAAMIDGLALRASLHPDQLPPALARSVVRRHLRQLSKA
ncbi:TetR/AcrR family transcriptional regulator [Rhodococcus sp. 06-235-1A]|uniref:TetR/AcrR family transcriptional regulator n=1 Tax=Rhodococcus sp. 06-235-1A TaxID=2022508 RepID=UPI0015C67385|nr:TetR family transcriptional regulator C-terminal domain-containing protein [Rhodococcus sp. 06-235-1A]